MTRSSLVTAVLALLVAGVALSGCGDDAAAEQRLKLILFHKDAVGLPSPDTSALRVTVVDRRNAQRIAQAVIPVADAHGTAEAPEIPFGEGLQAFAETLDAAGNTLASGGTPTFAVRDGETGVLPFLIYLAEVGSVVSIEAIYSPAAGENVPSVQPSLMEGGPRAGHTAELLADGRVLLIGGGDLTAAGAGLGGTNVKTVLDSLAVFNPATGYFDAALTPAGVAARLGAPRLYHASATLPDGRILVVGGLGATLSGEIATSAAVDLIEPQADGSFVVSALPNLSAPRMHHGIAVRASGSVIVTGGSQLGSSGAEIYLQSAEMLLPDAPGFIPIADMARPRAHHTTTALRDLVIVTGGINDTGPLADAELFLQGSGGTYQFTALPAMSTSRHGHAAVNLSTDSQRYLLVAGGFGANQTPLASFEIFNTNTGTWTTALTPRNFGTARAQFAMHELHDGTLVVAGGIGVGVTPGSLQSIDNVELLTPQLLGAIDYNVRTLPTTLSMGRFGIASAVLQSGMTAFFGGGRLENGGYAAYPLADLYNPGPPPIVTAP